MIRTTCVICGTTIEYKDPQDREAMLRSYGWVIARNGNGWECGQHPPDPPKPTPPPQLTVAQLITLLLLRSSRDLVYIEGCDCVGEARTVKSYGSGAVLIGRD